MNKTSDEFSRVHELKIGDFLGLVRFNRDFLIAMKMDPKRSAQSLAYLDRDIDGYEQILKKNCQEIAEHFIKEKSLARAENRKFADNFAVIEHLKAKGFWK